MFCSSPILSAKTGGATRAVKTLNILSTLSIFLPSGPLPPSVCPALDPSSPAPLTAPNPDLQSLVQGLPTAEVISGAGGLATTTPAGAGVSGGGGGGEGEGGERGGGEGISVKFTNNLNFMQQVAAAAAAATANAAAAAAAAAAAVVPVTTTAGTKPLPPPPLPGGAAGTHTATNSLAAPSVTMVTPMATTVVPAPAFGATGTPAAVPAPAEPLDEAGGVGLLKSRSGDSVGMEWEAAGLARQGQGGLPRASAGVAAFSSGVRGVHQGSSLKPAMSCPNMAELAGGLGGRLDERRSRRWAALLIFRVVFVCLYCFMRSCIIAFRNKLLD